MTQACQQRLAICFAAAVLAAVPASAFAQATFVGTNNAAWTTGANWSTNSVPTSTTDVVNNKDGVAVQINSTSSGTARNVTIAALTSGSTSTLTVSGTGSFANLVLGGVGIGALTLGNANSNLSVSGSITMAPGAGNATITLGSPTASLTVGGGSGSIVLGGGGGNSSIVTNGNFNGSINAAVINVNDLNMSQSGSSTLTVTAGQTYNVSNLVRANNASTVVTSAVLNINGGVFNSFGSQYRFNSGTGATNVSYLNLNSGTFAGVTVTRSNQGADAAFNWNNGTVANYTGGNLVILSDSSAWQLPVLLSGTGTNIFNAQSSGTITVQSTAFLGNKSGEQGRFTKSGAGTLILNGSNSYTGGTTLSSGTIQLGAAGALGPSGSLTFSGGVLQYTSSGTATDYSGRFANSGSAITIDSNSQSISFGSAIASTNTGGFRKIGSGTVTLSAANAFTGLTQVGAGWLTLGSVDALATSTLDLATADSGTVAFGVVGTNTYNLGGLQGSRNLANAGNGLSIGANNASTTYSGTLSGVGTVSKVGSGTLTLSAANSYTGLTTVSGGVLQYGIDNALSTGAVTIDSGATLDLSTYSDSVGTVTLTSGRIIGSGTLTSTANYALASGTVSAPLAGSVGLAKSGAGTVVLSAANAYTGLTTVSGGVLQYGIDNALSAGAVTIDSGATLDLSTYSDSVGTVTLTSGRIIGSGTLTSTANYALASGTVSAPLAGAVGLTKSGTGAVVLSAANAYTGLTTVSGGVLQFGANQTSSTSSVTVTSGTLDLNGYTMTLQSVPSQKGILLGGGTAGTRAFVSTGSGTMVIQSSAVIPWIQYDSTNNPLGAELAGNVRILSGGGFTGFMAGDSTATDEDLTISAVISGSLNTVYSTAAGTVVFTGLNTYAADGYQLRAGTWVLGTNALLNQPGALGNNGVTSVSVGHATQQQNAALFLRDGVTTDRRMTIVTNTASPFGFTRTIGGTFTSGTATFSGGMSLNTNAGVTAASGGTVVIGNSIIDGNTNFQSSGTFSKIGGGTVVFTGTNTFSYPTLISQGILSISSSNNLQNTAGVSIADTARLRYTGATGLFGRNVTVTSGTGTIENTGGGTLTLAGTLNKNGTVLRLTGGQFNVTGQITGTTVGTSDLLVDGTSTVTLSSANTYNGPTFVNQASNLIVGINNAIPSNSVVTLGNATTTGTLSLGSNSNAIGGLSFGAVGGTLRLAATSTSAASLTAPSGTMTLTNGTLDLAGSGSTAGLYRVLAAGTVSGSFASITGTSAAYQVVTTSSSVNYQQRAVLGAVSVTNPATAIITGGSAAFTYTVANTALSGGADLAFTGAGASNVAGSSTGTAAAAGTSSSVSGLFFTGTTTGSGRTGTFTVNAPNAFGTQTATGTVSVDVYAHAAGSATGATIALADSIVGYTGALSGLTSATISNAAGYRVNLMTTGGTSGGFVNINNVSGIVSGSSALVSAAASLNGSQTVGSNSIGQTFNLTYADDSALAGASNNLASQAITVTGKVLDHATSSLASGTSVLLSTVLNLGTWDYSKTAWTSGTNSGLFTIANLASIYGANLTADLSLVSVSGTGNGFTTNLNTYTDIAGGQSRQYSVFVDPASFLTSGTQSWTFTIGMSDKTGMAGATSTNTLSVTAQVIVVPEPGTLAMLAAGAAGVAVALRRRRR